MKKIIYILLVSGVLAIFFGVKNFFYSYVPYDCTIYIDPKNGTQDIIKELKSCDLPVFHKAQLWLYQKISGNTLKTGEYALKANWNVWQTFQHIASGQTKKRHITFPEGWTIHQIIQRLELEKFLTGSIDAENIEEGSCLPETYTFTRNDTRQSIINRMQKGMDQYCNKLLEENDGNNLSLKEIITLASIIECETPIDSEKPIVSAVFHKRLRENMPLQSDPTVIYALTSGKQTLSQRLTYKDLAYNSPYNTYLYRGIPPGPIACPGKAAIKAAMQPDPKSNYLYFVANGNGGHNFSLSLAEHHKNVALWKAFRKNNTLS